MRPDFPHYSTDIKDAWKIVAKLDGEWTIKGQEGIGWEVSFVEASMRADRHEKPFVATAGTLPHAICLVSLKVVGHLSP